MKLKRLLIISGIFILSLVLLINWYAGKILSEEVDSLIRTKVRADKEIERLDYDNLWINPLLKRANVEDLDYLANDLNLRSKDLSITMSWPEIFALLRNINQPQEVNQLKELKFKFNNLVLRGRKEEFEVVLAEVAVDFKGDLDLAEPIIEGFWQEEQKIKLQANDIKWRFLEQSQFQIKSDLQEIDSLNLNLFYQPEDKLLKVEEVNLIGPTLSIDHTEKMQLSGSYPNLELKSRDLTGQVAIATEDIQLSLANNDYQLKQLEFNTDYQLEIPYNLEELKLKGDAKLDLLVGEISAKTDLEELEQPLMGYFNQLEVKQLSLKKELVDLDLASQLKLASSLFDLNSKVDISLNLAQLEESWVNQLDLSLTEVDRNLEILLMLLTYETGLTLETDGAEFKYNYQGRLDSVF